MADCPSLEELADFTKTGGDAVLEQHVAGCRRCRALVRLLDERESAALDELTPTDVPEASLPHRAPPDGEFTLGEVCLVDTDFSDGTMLVAVVLDRAEGLPETLEV